MSGNGVKLTYEYAVTVTATGNITTANDDYLVDCTLGNITLTLPSCSATGLKGKIFTIRRIDATGNTLNVVPNGTDTIAGLTTVEIDNHSVQKLIRYNTNTWRRIMENKKLLSTVIYATAAPTIDANYDVVQLNTTGTAIAAVLPLASTLSLGQRVIVVTTSAAQAGTVAPGGTDTINGASTPIATVANVGKTFFVTSNASPGAWRQF